MAIVNFSVDTDTRQVVLTVNNQIVPIVACYLSRGVDYDGEQFLRLSYIVEVENQNGLKEKHEFFLPDPDDEAVFASTKDGLASKVLENGETVLSNRTAADIVNFLSSRKTS